MPDLPYPVELGMTLELNGIGEYLVTSCEKYVLRDQFKCTAFFGSKIADDFPI